MTIYHTDSSNKTFGSRAILEAYSQSDTDLINIVNNSIESVVMPVVEKPCNTLKPLKSYDLNNSTDRMIIEMLGVDKRFYQF